MKRLINREKVTLTILSLLVIVVLISATVAWFMGITPVSIRNLVHNIDDKGDLYVWVRVEEDIKEEDMADVLTILHNHINKANGSAAAYPLATAGNMASSGNLASAGNIADMEPAEVTENTASAGNLLDIDENASFLSKYTASAGQLAKNGNISLPTDEELREQHFLPLQKVGVGDHVQYTIDMNIVEQDNIEENTLAPGAYGKIEFKILSMTSLTTGYTLTITPELMGINEDFDTNGAGLTEEGLFDLVKTHIKFYAVDEAGQYSKVIPYYDKDSQNISLRCLTGNLEEGVMKDVVLYWYWPYEYVDIPDLYNVDSPVYPEYEKYRNEILAEGEREEDKVELYDWDDTYIGNYVEGLRFHFEVKGNRD